MKGNGRKKEKKQEKSDNKNKVLTEYQKEKAGKQPEVLVIKSKS